MRTNTKNISPIKRRSNHPAGRCFKKAAAQPSWPTRPILPLPLSRATPLCGVETTNRIYNGKELEQENGLDCYDYAARIYDAALCRFTTVDPHAENYYSYSPYAYCGNNPVNIIDPNGLDWHTDSIGNAHYINDDSKNK